MSLSDTDRAQLSDEKLDPRKLNLACAIHGYYGPFYRDSNFQGARIVPATFREHPVSGCSACLKVFYIFDILSVTPSERAQRFEELEEVVTKLVEYAETGQFDFRAYTHPVIEYDE